MIEDTLAPPQAAPEQAVAPRRIQPVRSLLRALLRAAPQLTPRVERLMWRAFYEAASLGGRELGTTLMNYGYAPADEREMLAPPGPDRFGLELYARVAGGAELAGRDVLEVSCGRGGGTAFVFERFGPRSMTGMDLARQAIARCRRRYGRPGLRFVAGEAERLPFDDGAFDAVLNVEAAHCYSDTMSFLRETHRVLRPGGVLLLADFRHTTLPPEAANALVPQEDLPRLREQLGEAGFRIREEEEITPAVLRALELDTPRRRERIEARVPKLLRRHALAFTAIEGSPMYEAFADGRWTYVRIVAERA